MNTQRGRLSPKLNWRRRMRNTSQTICITKSLAALSLVAALAACGGGGGDSSTSSSTSGSSSSSGGSAVANRNWHAINASIHERQRAKSRPSICSINTVPSAAFPRCRRTPLLDQAAQSHAKSWASTAPYRIAKHREAQDLPVRLIKIERWPQDCRLPRLAQV